MIHFHARQSSLQVLAQTHQALAHPTAHRERISHHVTATAMHDTMVLPLDGGSDGNPRCLRKPVAAAPAQRHRAISAALAHRGLAFAEPWKGDPGHLVSHVGKTL
eukprot:Skav207856  [mRNA]  locus=scaffold3511:11237:13642:+ [translate_table: standard]